jgi:hypothetical protein
MKFIKYIFITFFILGIFNLGIAHAKKDSLHILFVGNSYTSVPNMPQLVSQISDSTRVKLITTRSTAAGATLSDHWNGEKELKTKEAIKNGKYDIVVIQGHSLETIENKHDFLMYSKLLCDLVKESGARPYLYVTWARQNTPQYQDTINKVYQQAAHENNCELIRVGEAWKLARSLKPDINLFMPDGSHQSDLGAILTACVFVSKFSGELPPKLKSKYHIINSKSEPVVLNWDNLLDVEFCQKVATEFIETNN